VIDNFGTNIHRYDLRPSGLLQFRIKASNKAIILAREVLKIDVFISQIFAFLFFIFLLFSYLNQLINNFEMKKSLIFALFKNHDINSAMMKKLKVLQEKYNETEYKDVPDFADRKC
jgi:hypothetical protein